MAGLLLGLGVLLCAGCGTSGIRIINCNNNKVEIFEDSPAPVTCGDITSTADVVWRLKNGLIIGECKADGTCSPGAALYNDYRLTRSPQSTESQLTLVPDYRRHAGVTVTCQDRGGSSTASCTLVIRRHSELSECHVTTNPVDWTVSGSCRVQQAFSSDNNYSCSWRLNDGRTFGGFENNRVRVRCSFINAPLPRENGVYTYTIAVFPPPVVAFSKTIRKDPNKLIAVQRSDSTRKLSDYTKWIISGVITAIIIALLIVVNYFITSRHKYTLPGLWYNKNWFKRNYPQTSLGEHSGETCTAVDQSTGLSDPVSAYDLTSRQEDSGHTGTGLRRKAHLVARELQLHLDLTSPSDNHGNQDIQVRNTVEDGAATHLTDVNVYENLQTLSDQTYDTALAPEEDHQYADLKVKARGKVKVTQRGVPDGEDRDSTVYNNVL
ncbi:uncharacterized protein LOC112568987 isoform X2 [Pomacea canaliculata]|uniref:uncharacterized protein LOC112568987 isoform X2 n=1 Tax=Pomacea canaliculata TaxID=400727 RepID=UPI000D72EE73|nr:uncharacterized protein LOC112568987 isoform X2 [Pomacea canaliculata]